MKKALIVIDNFELGGIQKSLINFLRGIETEYQIDIFSISKTGELVKDIPSKYNIFYSNRFVAPIATQKSKLRGNPISFCLKGIYKIIAKVFNRGVATNLAFATQKTVCDYDIAISYSNPGPYKDTIGTSCEFVIKKIKADTKICFIHCDYENSGVKCDYNNSLIKKFDKIACCSISVRSKLIDSIPSIKKKTFVLRNFYDLSIVEKAKNDPFVFDCTYINLVIVARLTYEKGIDRAVEALKKSNRTDIRMYIIGSGPEEEKIKQYVKDNNLEHNVFFVGEQKNPYKYFLNADYLFVPSRYEAAPIIYDEATILKLPIITTETTSTHEMLKRSIILENSTDAMISNFMSLNRNNHSENEKCTNILQNKQFKKIIG